MRALRLHGPGDLRLEELPEPVLGPGDVLLRVDAALTCATDAKMLRRGAHPALPPLPAPFGHEAAGTVVAIGPETRGFSVGERAFVANSAPCGECPPCRAGRSNLCERIVYLTGAFAELLRVPQQIVERNMLRLPSGVALEHAAMVEPLACAVHGATRCGAASGETVVILGGGVHGALLCALLARRGCRVVVCDPHPERRERALRFGAELALPAPRDHEGRAAVRRVTPGGRGAHAVVEAVGRVQVWESAVELVRPGGEVTLYGGCPVGTRVALPTYDLHYLELTLRGAYHHTPDAVREACELVVSGQVPVAELLGEPIGLGEVAEALVAGGPKRPVITTR